MRAERLVSSGVFMPDLGLLRRHYPMAKAWVDLVERLAGTSRLWDTGSQLGDWLEAAAPPDDPAAGRTDRYLVATAYFAHSARHLALAAAELGYEQDAVRYETLAEEVADAFRRRYVLPSGRMASDSATAYALALVFGLLRPEQRQPAGDRLAELDSLRPAGTLDPGGMTSFNHYALGAVADWLHRAVGGITATAPGYRRIAFRPRPGGGITWARTRHETPYGTASLSWQLTATGMTARVAVPDGCTATADLPGCAPVLLGPGEHALDTANLAAEAA
ncbi:alpha-L-rhamnosidase C-terminal domain-containing protein [Streptomyces sp. MBT33]|uniref:alpha-L-rhamnosidase-related protein n=1 Tax=Streptomyces sp. MBT33 TaxID=1488363 RepID=UPI0027DD4FE4|nr:alpha-L-rhamnosidase C-terminal domain-containing protein [Streptomyces sp. MBT33]